MVEEAQRQRTIFPNARRQKTTPKSSSKPWRSAEGLPKHINTEKEWNKFQIRANEPGARAAQQQVFNDYRSQGLYPWNLHSRPELDWSEGKQDILRWDVRPANVERVDPTIMAQTKWKDNIPLMLRSLRQRDEFKDWSDDELTHYMHRTFSNRGGLMSLV